MRALKIDLGPILGDTGIWALNNYKQAQTQKGNQEKKKIIAGRPQRRDKC